MSTTVMAFDEAIAWIKVMVIVVVVVVRIGVLVIALGAMEDQEVHAEGVEGGDEHPRHHGEVGKRGAGQRALGNRLDDAVLRVKT